MEQFFSASYDRARETFRIAAEAAGASLETIPHPEPGIHGEALSCDIAWLGPSDAKAVLVTVSGTHGIEGYYGSGCQTGWLRERGRAALPRGTAMLLVHASNPYGFSWGRRVNEDNMDINRNFVAFERGAVPENPAYAEVHPWLLPDEWTEASIAEMQKKLEAYYARVGARAANAAIVGGQHSHADGIFYGGRQPCWSHRQMRALAGRYLRGRHAVCILDFHTGLGPFGYSELICRHAPGSKALEQARAWFGAAVTSPALGQSDSPIIEGNLRMGLSRFIAEANPETLVVASGIEVGTLESMKVRLSVIADNWLHLKGRLDSDQGRAIKKQIRAAFYPESREWFGLCYPRALEIQMQALAGLAAA